MNPLIALDLVADVFQLTDTLTKLCFKQGPVMQPYGNVSAGELSTELDKRDLAANGVKSDFVKRLLTHHVQVHLKNVDNDIVALNNRMVQNYDLLSDTACEDISSMDEDVLGRHTENCNRNAIAVQQALHNFRRSSQHSTVERRVKTRPTVLSLTQMRLSV